MPWTTSTLLTGASLALLALTSCSDSGAGQGEADLEGGQSEVLGEADEGIEGVQAVRVYYADPVHTAATVDYELRPPAGGIHDDAWWSCGFHDQVAPDEHVVHDLEHGVVWLAYDPELPDPDLEVIHEIARANPRVLASPYPSLPKGEAVVATAWARQLRLPSVQDPRLEAFVAEYQDGSQAPEAGASCDSPLGEPVP